MKKRMIAALLVLCLCLTAVACTADSGSAPAPAVTPEPTPEPAPDAPEPGELDLTAPAVTLGDYTVTVSDIKSSFDYLMSYMSYYGMAPTDEAGIKEAVDLIVSDSVNSIALCWQADQLGLTLNEEQLAAIEAEAAAESDDLIATYTEEAKNQLGAEASEDEIAAKTMELVNEDCRSYMGVSFDEYMVNVRDSLTRSAKAALLEADVKADVSITEEDTAAWYEAELTEQKNAFTESPLSYRDSVTDYESHVTDVPVLFAPEGFLRVQLITVAPDADFSASVSENTEKMQKLEAEYGHLALNGEDEVRQSEIITEYASIKELNTLGFEALKSKADMIREETLTSNMLFSEIAKKYDESLTGEQAENGHLFYIAGEDSAFPSALVEAAKALGDGDISDVIEIENTWYIIRRVGEVPSGEIALADIGEAASAQALLEKQSAVWEAAAADYQAAAAEVAVMYPENYKNITF